MDLPNLNHFSHISTMIKAAAAFDELREQQRQSALAWDTYFMQMAKLVASKSKDKSTQCGAVVVGDGQTILATGYNGFPRYVNDNVPERHERPEKYFWTEHAERNAIYNAARNGSKLLSSTMYITGHPCADCARAIIQAGIVRVILPEKDPFLLLDRWTESVTKAKTLLKEAGVDIINVV